MHAPASSLTSELDTESYSKFSGGGDGSTFLFRGCVAIALSLLLQNLLDTQITNANDHVVLVKVMAKR